MNAYEILGVSNDCEQIDIKKSYRKLSLQYHPDRNESDEAKTKILEINDAYEKIGDVGSRKNYDQQSNNPLLNNNIPDDVQNIFNMMFSGGMAMGGGIHMFHGGGFPGFNTEHFFQKPIPIIKNLQLSFEEMYSGCTKTLEFERWRIINNEKHNENVSTTVKIPPGINDNEIILLQECGNIINEHMKGDIKIVIKIDNTTPFIRDGMNLFYTKKITLKESLCGLSFKITRLNGEDIILNTFKIPTVIFPSFVKTIPMMGINRDNQTGNLIIMFEIIFPDKLTIEQIETLRNTL